MATNAVVGSILKMSVKTGDATDLISNYTVTADYYTYGKSDTVVSVTEFQDNTTVNADYLCAVDTSTLSAGNLYAKVTIAKTDADFNVQFKSVFVVDTGVRLVNVQ